MNLIFEQAKQQDSTALAELRVRAMKPSLEAVGRFDPIRARERFLSSFNSVNTTKIMHESELVGFMVVLEKGDHIWLDHLYIEPDCQGRALGTHALDRVKVEALKQNLPIRLCALKESASNRFYQAQGFVFQHEEQWDNYYQFGKN